MSDLISTPSQTQSPVSNDAFEALIDLLTSDGIDENLSESHTQSQANVSLRDPSGKLDYDKIRLMFTSQRAKKPQREERQRVRSVQTPTLPNDEDDSHDSDDEPHSHRSAPSTSSSRSHSMSPKPIEPTTVGHRRSSTFGNQPWTPPIRIVAETKAKDVPPTLLPRPLSFDELNTALAGAQEEVKSLRQQYDQLRDLVFKCFGPERLESPRPGAANTDKVTPTNTGGRFETRATASQAQSKVVPPSSLPSDVLTEVTNLSETEAKRALCAIAHSLNLSPSAIGAMASLSTPVVSTSLQQSLSTQGFNRQHDVASIACALRFLGTVDELVWRRTSTPSGPRTLLPVFSEENVVALVARLQLWERAVRRSTRY